MSALLYEMLLRFRRQRVWVLALALPAVLAAVLAFRGRPAEAAGALLGCLHHLLPPLAALLLLTPEPGGLDVLLSRPLRWPALVLGRWAGAAAVLGGCHLLLAGGVLGLAAAGGGPPGKVLRDPEARLIEPSAGAVSVKSSASSPDAAGGVEARPGDRLLQPWPDGPAEPAWIDALDGSSGWTFRFSGIPAGVPLTARAWPLAARVLIHEEKGRRPRRILSRESLVAVDVSWSGSGAAGVPGGRIDLRDAGPLELEVPRGVVGADGRLAIRLLRAGDDLIWFDPSGDGDPLQARDVKVAVGEVGHAANAFRAAMMPLGKLVLVAGAAAVAAALFSPGVAFALVLTFYLGSSGLGFLREVVETLSHQSVLVLLEDPHEHAHVRRPWMLEKGLQAFLSFWIWVLPDFELLHGLRRLSSAEAVRWSDVGRSLGLGAGTALLAQALALPALRWRSLPRRGARR